MERFRFVVSSLVVVVSALLLPACGSDTTVTTPTTATATVIDLTRIPIGDGKLSTTTPQIGFVFSCTTPTSSAPPGKAPWISADGLTWNQSAKASVGGSVSWPSTFSTSATTSSLVVNGNGLPAHATGTFPISASDPAYQYDRNPNSIQSVAIAWGLPANPAVAATPSCTPLGAIGVLTSGARLFNALDADGRDAAAHEVQDACDGHPQAAGMYHYHSLSRCIAQTDVAGQHSALVGYVADGFGLYGLQGENGTALTNADLDVCHGHTHMLTVNGVSVLRYHYHTTREYPYTVGCFRGTPVAIR